jgi:Retinal pigment epithelial membrane protein
MDHLLYETVIFNMKWTHHEPSYLLFIKCLLIQKITKQNSVMKIERIDAMRRFQLTKNKRHVVSGENEGWWAADNHYPTELTFIPAPEGSAEDDGVLLTIAYDGVRYKPIALSALWFAETQLILTPG